MIPTTTLIASVCLLMLAATCAVAFAHGWQDGDQPDPDRHAWIPRAAYWAGGRLRQSRLDTARAELEQRRVDRDAANAILDQVWRRSRLDAGRVELEEQRARTDAFYAILDAAVQTELRRKDQTR